MDNLDQERILENKRPKMKKCRVICCQMPVSKGKVFQNLDWILGHLGKFSFEKNDLLCLPEMWSTDFSKEKTAELAKETKDAWNQLAREAQKLGIYLCGSALERGKAAQFFNTAFLLGPDHDSITKNLGKYQKIHLFSPLEEDQYFQVGKELAVVNLPHLNLGMAICYDLRFPELFRSLARRGSEIIVVPSAWPHSRLQHWRVLLQARAIENQVFAIGVNRQGKSERGFDFAGHSMVVDPWGEILWEAKKDEQGLFACEMDLSRIPAIREQISVWQDGKTELYKEWIGSDAFEAN